MMSRTKAALWAGVVVVLAAVGLGLLLRGEEGPEPQGLPGGDRVAVDDGAGVELLPVPPGTTAREVAAGTDRQSGAVEARGWIGAAGQVHRAGRVVDQEGRPVEGASVSWTVVPTGLGWNWQEVDRELLEGSTAWATSDADGAFVVAEFPAGDGGAVVWATRPGYAAGFARVAAGDQELVEDLVLIQAAQRRVQIVYSDGGEPVSGAVVRQLAVVGRDAGRAEAEARRVFARSFVADDAGMAELPSLDGKDVLTAEHGGLCSAPCIQEGTEDASLALVEVFTATGLVHVDGGLPGEGARVERAALCGGEWVELGASSVSSDGSWGPSFVPLLDAQAYRFVLAGGGLVKTKRELSPPGAGDLVTIDFRTEVGVDQWFVVLDADTDDPLADARVRVHWMEADQSWTTLELRPGEEGYALATGCRPGAIYYDGQAPGYSFARRGPTAIPLPQPGTLTVSVAPAGGLSLRCVHRGEPVADFDLVHWPGDAEHEYQVRSVRDQEDGVVVLEALPRGEVSLIAHAVGYGQSEVERVLVLAGETAEVTLELSDSFVAEGVVVDQLTGEPLRDASVLVSAAYGTRAFTPVDSPARTDDRGRFEVAGVSRHGSTLDVSAPGYSARLLAVQGGTEERIDVGSVALSPSQPLEVRLHHGAGSMPTRFSVYTTGNELLPTPFGRDGTVRVDSFAAGTYKFVVRTPEGQFVSRYAYLAPGEDWVVGMRVDGGGRLDVEVEPAEGAGLPPDLWVLVCFDSDGGPVVHEARIQEQGPVPFEDLPAGPYHAKVLSGMTILAGRGGTLAEGGDELVTLRLDEPPHRFRVVDDTGAPVSSVYVQFALDGSERGELGGTTDARGELVCGGFGSASVTANLEHGRGTVVGLPVELGPVDQVIELRLAASHHWAAVLKDGESFAAGLSCRLAAPGSAFRAGQLQTSDAAGYVGWERLGPGDYRFLADHPDYWPVEVVLPSTPDGAHAIEVRRRGDLVVRALSSAGARLAGFPLALESVELGADVREWLQAERVGATPPSLSTDSSGEILVQGLPHGPYRWRVDGPGGEVQSGTVVVPPGDRAEVDVRFP